MDELHSFYSDLYSDRNNGEVTDQSCAFLETESIPKLSSVMEELCIVKRNCLRPSVLIYYLIKKTRPLEMVDLL